MNKDEKSRDAHERRERSDDFDLDVRLGDAAGFGVYTDQTKGQECQPLVTQQTCCTGCNQTCAQTCLATCKDTCYDTCGDTCYDTCAQTCPPTCQLACVDTQHICIPTNQCIQTKGPTCQQTCYTCCSMC